MHILNKEQLQLFNNFIKENNKIHGKPMTLGEKREYEKRASSLCEDNKQFFKTLCILFLMY